MSEEQGNPQENQPVNPVNSDAPAFGSINQPPVTPPPFQQNPPFGQFGGGMGQQSLPNSTASLILGVLAIPACCFYGIFGLIFGIIAWVLGSGEIKKYNVNPNFYTISSYKNAKAGKICGIIAVIMSILFIVVIVIFGAAFLSNHHLLEELMKNRR